MRHWTAEERARQAEKCRQARPWTKSTGPRTAAGKAVCARNAVKHGFRSAPVRELLRLLAAQRRYVALALAPGLIAACSPALTPQDFAGRTPEMRPETFFAGATASTGVLEDRGGAPTDRFTVRGQGTVLPDGSFRLTQDIRFEHDAAPVHRAWAMRRLDAHRYAGALDGASGPVEMAAWGNVLHIAYPMASPPGGRMEQWLYLQPDGVTVLNEATVRIAGIVVVRLSERITHQGR